MNEQNKAILRDKLNGTRVASTGQSQAPTEVDAWNLPAARRAIRNLQWVVDAIIGDLGAEDATDPGSLDALWNRVVMAEKEIERLHASQMMLLAMSVCSTSFIAAGTLVFVVFVVYRLWF